MSNARLLGEAEPLDKRKLSEATCEKYKIYRDGDVLRFHYFSNDGVLKGAKIKTKKKVFTYEGEATPILFGLHLYPRTGRRIVITEGEIDAASVSQSLGNSWPVVSLPFGAASAKKSIKQNLEFLQDYEEIVLWFDDDEAGRKATQEACSVLPPGKTKIALCPPYKDASEALMSASAETLRHAVWNAETYRPDGIIDGKSLLTEICTPQPPCEYEYPYVGLQEKLHGIRYSELTTITSGSGLGKSSFCRELCTHLLEQGERVGYVALEESNRRTALGLMSSALGTNLNLGEHNVRKLTEAYDASLDRWNLFLFDGFGSFDPDIIYNRIEYLALGLDCRIIFLDHLSILMSGLDGDERRMLDITMTRLRSLVERCGIHLFLVSHLRRTQNDQNHEEGARVTLGQLRGSAAIAQLSDQVIALERDQQSGDGNSQTTVRILKNRYSGETGIACYLDYNLETCRFTENEIKPEFDPASDF
jgi:twinkle protein